MSYENPKRPTGSQSETPTYRRTGNDIIVGGYQRFIINGRDGSVDLSSNHYKAKFAAIRTFLAALRNTCGCNSVADLGCSNGLVCFLAAKEGYKSILGLDHDQQCLSLIGDVSTALSIPTIARRHYKFGQPVPPVDVVVACAIIHWVYSCTASYGSLASIIGYLASLTKRALIVEWISPSDGAIRSFHHLDFGKKSGKRPYTLSTFLSALKTNFALYKKVKETTTSRWLYVAFKKDTPENRAFLARFHVPTPIRPGGARLGKHPPQRARAQRRRGLKPQRPRGKGRDPSGILGHRIIVRGRRIHPSLAGLVGTRGRRIHPTLAGLVGTRVHQIHPGPASSLGARHQRVLAGQNLRRVMARRGLTRGGRWMRARGGRRRS